MGWASALAAGADIGKDFAFAAYGDYRARKAASAQRAWLEKMDNSKHQREVKDLRAAGLNPILSATAGGSLGVPNAQMARVPDYDSNASALHSYISLKQLKMQEAQNESQVELNKELANKSAAEAGTALQAGWLYGMQRNVAAASAANIESQTRYNSALTEAIRLDNVGKANTAKFEKDTEDWNRAAKFGFEFFKTLKK